MNSIFSSIRLAILTMLVVVVAYTAILLGVAKTVAPQTALGSLVTRPDGSVVGSFLVAQKFTQPKYFWPRPSAVDYNAAGAGGSNKSPTSADLTDRASKTVAEYGATPAKPLPADLAAASGAGLDPHLTERAAIYQVNRIAQARALNAPDVEALVRRHAFSPGGFLTGPLVNVLALNLALDEMQVH